MKLISLSLALVAPSWAYIRFGCATLSMQRLDPVVEVIWLLYWERIATVLTTRSQAECLLLIFTRQDALDTYTIKRLILRHA